MGMQRPQDFLMPVCLLISEHLLPSSTVLFVNLKRNVHLFIFHVTDRLRYDSGMTSPKSECNSKFRENYPSERLYSFKKNQILPTLGIVFRHCITIQL